MQGLLNRLVGRRVQCANNVGRDWPTPLHGDEVMIEAVWLQDNGQPGRVVRMELGVNSADMFYSSNESGLLLLVSDRDGNTAVVTGEWLVKHQLRSDRLPDTWG